MATPTMIQHISAAANPGGGAGTPAGNAFKIPITHPVGAANCLILCITFTSGLTATITDNNSNSWPGSATVTADAGGSFGKSQIFVLPNANSGQTTITVTFGSTTAIFTYTVSEWMNVATSSPVDGASTVGFNSTVFNCPAAPYTTGSFHPTNAAGNDLIFAYYCYNGGTQNGTPTNWSPGGSFTLLDGNLGNGVTGTSGGVPHASMYFIQSSSAAINPAITMTGDTSDTVNALGVALKSASAGTARAAGIHVDRLIHETSSQATGSLLSRCVFTGNLRVIVCGFTRTNEINVTGVTDSDGNTWTDASAAASDKPMIFYKTNTSASSNTLITMATTGTSVGSQQSWRIFDISGADPSAFDTYVGTVKTSFSTGTLSNAPSITPGVSSGIALGTVLVALGNAHSATAPTGVVYDACDYTGNGATDQLENADGFGHVLFSSNATQNWAWTMTTNASNFWWSAAATFKAASSTTPTWGWQTGDDKERLLAPQIERYYSSPFFQRSLVPVPTRWLPITGMEDRPPMPSKRPDDSSIESPETTFFVPSPNPVPARWLPITGEEDRPPHPNRILAPDQPYPWFVRSPNPVPGIWLPTTGEEDRPPAQKRPPDETGAYFRSPKSFPAIWLPTTGEEDRPPNPNKIRSPDEPFPWFVRSPNPVPTIWLQQLDGWERPKRIDLDPSGTAFVRQFVATVPISGIAWYVPGEDKERLPRITPDASLTAFSFKTPAAVNTIAGMAWFNPPETRLPPVSGDPYAVQALPFFIVPPLQRFFAQTNADDFSPLKAIQPADIAISWTPKVFAASVGISGIAWYAPYADRERPPKASPDASLTSFSFKTPAVINTIAGMAWHNPPDTRPPPVLGDPYGVQTIPFFIEPPLLTFMASGNAEDFNPLPIFKFEEHFLAFTPKPPAAPVTPISGIAWTSQPETRPPPVLGDPYTVQTLPWFIAPPLFTFMASANAEDFNPLQKPISALDGSVFPFRLIAPPVGVSGVAWWRQTEVYVGPPPPQLDYVVSWNPQFITPPAVGLLLLRTLMGTGL